ncbi:MAG: hypothetical protein ABSB96_00510 [Gaiellaceae bacterium]
MSPSAEEPADEEARSDVRSLCPHCGAVCEPYQEYCLSCGERLFEEGVVVERWRYALPFSNGGWRWSILIALAIAVLAATFAILATQSNQTKTLQELGPTVHPTTASTGTVTGQTVTGTTTPTTTGHKPPKPPVDSTGLIAWPGPPDYTIVLASIPISGGKAGARQKALEALNAGLGDVGVLKSSDYSSLHPGYYVVFSGIFDDQSAAFRRLPAARKAGFKTAFVKRVAS